MGFSSIITFLCFLLSLQYFVLLNASFREAQVSNPSFLHSPQTPSTYFQVSSPIKTPNINPCSSVVLQLNFNDKHRKPLVKVPYNPPRNCSSSNYSLVILELNATCTRNQIDRIFGIWLGGVEILRSSIPETTLSVIQWSFQKDVTRYSSLFQNPNELRMYIGSDVDNHSTRHYHITVTLHFYPSFKIGPSDSGAGFLYPADLIEPISRNFNFNGGLWFPIINSTDIQVKEFVIPSNSFRAVLEIYASCHDSDEFWYSNPPNQYLSANNLTEPPGNGVFRELAVTLDGKLIGFVWPYPVIYAGKINPSLWSQIVSIRSFDFPSYDIEITPFLGFLLDEKPHKLGFSVSNGLNSWYVDANLHIWLDRYGSKTEGHLIKHQAKYTVTSLRSNFKSKDGSFLTTSKNYLSNTGWVRSSLGNITSHSFQGLNFTNLLKFSENGTLKTVNQMIHFDSGAYAKFPRNKGVYSTEIYRKFPLNLYSKSAEEAEKGLQFSNFSLGFHVKQYLGSPQSFQLSYLTDEQFGSANMSFHGGDSINGSGNLQEVYIDEGFTSCYYRNVSSKNYHIRYDKHTKRCPWES